MRLKEQVETLEAELKRKPVEVCLEKETEQIGEIFNLLGVDCV